MYYITKANFKHICRSGSKKEIDKIFYLEDFRGILNEIGSVAQS